MCECEAGQKGETERKDKEQIRVCTTFHRETIYILSLYYVDFEWALQIFFGVAHLCCPM